MEEFGDWLYWIIIIIAGISSLIGSINKKNRQAAENRQPREVITEEWVDWEDRNDGAKTPQPVIQEKIPDLQAQRKAAFSHEQFNRDAKRESDSFIFKQEAARTAALYAEDDTAATTGIGDLPSDTNEWRKAFIYNEIFKRKY
ncbi:MAG: hypothetical protein LBJ23_11505 [Tannerella sp.]|jgi:hypothetical protein|nr:hypothetical protein [Tannerella sp.]